MPDPPFEVGELIRLSADFRDGSTGSGIDPTLVTVKVKNPLGTIGTYVLGGASTPIRTATGLYYLDVLTDSAGPWRFRWQASGPLTAEEGSFPVASTAF